MMKKSKFFLAALTVAAAMLLASNCYAQSNIAPVFNAVGSSGAFNSFALAARISNPGGQSGVCGDHNWTLKNGAMGFDNRGDANIATVTGNVWIVWNDTPEPNRTVCAYLNIDSVVGNRLFFGSPQGLLQLPSSDIGAAGGNLVPLLPSDEPLPQSIYTDLNNAVFNAAPSDIRPEDALFATTRALAPFTSNASGLGYGPGPVGAEVLSAFSSKSAQVVDYAITGNDPITGQKVVKATATDVGAQVMLILANTTDGGPAGLGNPIFNNVDRFVLGSVLAGQLYLTRDLVPSSGLPAVGMDIITREPTSGTMNTTEFSLTRNVEVNLSQELGVNPTTDNPLNISLNDGAKRQRAIGTGEEVSEIGSNADAIGYAFFSFGNVSGVLTTAKYLTVDGVDPLYASTSQNPNGPNTLPQCSAPCPGAVTFYNVINGSYPIWNVLRVISASPVPNGISQMITAAENQVSNIPDFLAFSQLEVFRSHYLQSGVQPHNGHLGRNAVESGGDVGGAVYTVQSDLDNIADTGKEILNRKQ